MPRKSVCKLIAGPPIRPEVPDALEITIPPPEAREVCGKSYTRSDGSEVKILFIWKEDPITHAQVLHMCYHEGDDVSGPVVEELGREFTAVEWWRRWPVPEDQVLEYIQAVAWRCIAQPTVH